MIARAPDFDFDTQSLQKFQDRSKSGGKPVLAFFALLRPTTDARLLREPLNSQVATFPITTSIFVNAPCITRGIGYLRSNLPENFS